MTITRRAALTAFASIPALGAAAIVPAMAEPVEGWVKPADAPKMPMGFRSGPIPPDPLVRLIKEYRDQIAVFNSIPEDEITKDNEPEYVAATYEAPMRQLIDETPPTTSLEGVREAIRLAFAESGFCCTLSENVLRSALAYLDGEALA